MKILVVSLLKRRVEPGSLAARPRVIYELSRGLVQKGHEVSLLGTGDSILEGAKILSIIPKSFTDLPSFENPFYAETAYLVTLAKKIEEIADQFDIIHNHTYPEFINLMLEGNIKTPMVTTLHAQATEPYDKVLSLFPDTNLISISQSHKSLFKKAKISKVIYNGIDTDLYAFEKEKDDYLLWLGRLSKAKDEKGEFMDPKGIRWAIKLAQATGSRLKLSGNVEDMEFFNRDVKPYLSDKIEWVGPVSSELSTTKQEVARLMQKARCYLMTVNWQEPFGLVMAEAGSCGTPVIGFDRGSVKELVVDGKTGFVVAPDTGIEGLKTALSKIDHIKPEDCRSHIVENFSLDVMVKNYEKTYQEVIKK